jgi:hypothetical protein
LCPCEEEYLLCKEEEKLTGKFLTIREKQILFFFRLSEKA